MPLRLDEVIFIWSMDHYVTVYLHVGDKLMPRSFATVPRTGEIVSAGQFGKLVVSRVEYDEQGDPHLYLEAPSSTQPAPPVPKAAPGG